METRRRDRQKNGGYQPRSNSCWRVLCRGLVVEPVSRRTDCSHQLDAFSHSSVVWVTSEVQVGNRCGLGEFTGLGIAKNSPTICFLANRSLDWNSVLASRSNRVSSFGLTLTNQLLMPKQSGSLTESVSDFGQDQLRMRLSPFVSGIITRSIERWRRPYNAIWLGLINMRLNPDFRIS